jgi:hypothetical protein
MADLNTAQKAPLIITDFYGNPLSATGSTITTDTPGVVQSGNINGTYWLTALAPGDVIVTVSKGGTSGSLPVHVTAAPLTLTLGTPEPK